MTGKIDLSNRAPRKAFTSADIPGLFSSTAPQPDSVIQIPLRDLIAWEQQPFKPYPDERLSQLAQDIKANGVMNPIIVRPHGNQYQIIAGHNRWNASRHAGLSTIPAIVRDVDDDAATLIMVNTNLNQREQLLPSEKAFAYKMQMEAMKRQAGRHSKENASQNGTQKRSDEILAEQTGESRNQIARYIRLTYLIPELLEMVDNGMLGFVPAVTLSYLTVYVQQLVCDVSAECEKKISTMQAEKLKQSAKSGLTETKIRAILLPEKPWNPQGAFLANTKKLIPNTATTEDIAQIVKIIEEFFKEQAKHGQDLL